MLSFVLSEFRQRRLLIDLASSTGCLERILFREAPTDLGPLLQPHIIIGISGRRFTSRCLGVCRATAFHKAYPRQSGAPVRYPLALR